MSILNETVLLGGTLAPLSREICTRQDFLLILTKPFLRLDVWDKPLEDKNSVSCPTCPSESATVPVPTIFVCTGLYQACVNQATALVVFFWQLYVFGTPVTLAAVMAALDVYEGDAYLFGPGSHTVFRESPLYRFRRYVRNFLMAGVVELQGGPRKWTINRDPIGRPKPWQ